MYNFRGNASKSIDAVVGDPPRTLGGHTPAHHWTEDASIAINSLSRLEEIVVNLLQAFQDPTNNNNNNNNSATFENSGSYGNTYNASELLSATSTNFQSPPPPPPPPRFSSLTELSVTSGGQWQLAMQITDFIIKTLHVAAVNDDEETEKKLQKIGTNNNDNDDDEDHNQEGANASATIFRLLSQLEQDPDFLSAMQYSSSYQEYRDYCLELNNYQQNLKTYHRQYNERLQQYYSNYYAALYNTNNNNNAHHHQQTTPPPSTFDASPTMINPPLSSGGQQQQQQQHYSDDNNQGHIHNQQHRPSLGSISTHNITTTSNSSNGVSPTNNNNNNNTTRSSSSAEHSVTSHPFGFTTDNSFGNANSNLFSGSVGGGGGTASSFGFLNSSSGDNVAGNNSIQQQQSSQNNYYSSNYTHHQYQQGYNYNNTTTSSAPPGFNPPTLPLPPKPPKVLSHHAFTVIFTLLQHIIETVNSVPEKSVRRNISEFQQQRVASIFAMQPNNGNNNKRGRSNSSAANSNQRGSSIPMKLYIGAKTLEKLSSNNNNNSSSSSSNNNKSSSNTPSSSNINNNNQQQPLGEVPNYVEPLLLYVSRSTFVCNDRFEVLGRFLEQIPNHPGFHVPKSLFLARDVVTQEMRVLKLIAAFDPLVAVEEVHSDRAARPASVNKAEVREHLRSMRKSMRRSMRQHSSMMMSERKKSSRKHLTTAENNNSSGSFIDEKAFEALKKTAAGGVSSSQSEKQQKEKEKEKAKAAFGEEHVSGSDNDDDDEDSLADSSDDDDDLLNDTALEDEENAKTSIDYTQLLQGQVFREKLMKSKQFRRGLMCRHPHICSRYDVIFDERVGGAFLVSAHAEHGTLLTLDHSGNCSRSRDICTARCLWYCRQLLDALVYLHDRGVVHGFISCNDVLLGQDDNVLLKRHGMVSETIDDLLRELLEIAVGLKMNSSQLDLTQFMMNENNNHNNSSSSSSDLLRNIETLNNDNHSSIPSIAVTNLSSETAVFGGIMNPLNSASTDTAITPATPLTTAPPAAAGSTETNPNNNEQNSSSSNSTKYQELRQKLLKEVFALRAVPKRSSHHDNMASSVITALEHIDAIYDYCFQPPEALHEIKTDIEELMKSVNQNNNNSKSSPFAAAMEEETNNNNNNNNNINSSSSAAAFTPLKNRISALMQRDIYSLGMVMYVMTFGCLPFRISPPSSFSKFNNHSSNNTNPSFGYQGTESNNNNNNINNNSSTFDNTATATVDSATFFANASSNEFGNTLKPSSSLLHQQASSNGSFTNNNASSPNTIATPTSPYSNLQQMYHYASYYAQSKPQFPTKPSPLSVKNYINEMLECCPPEEEHDDDVDDEGHDELNYEYENNNNNNNETPDNHDSPPDDLLQNNQQSTSNFTALPSSHSTSNANLLRQCPSTASTAVGGGNTFSPTSSLGTFSAHHNIRNNRNANRNNNNNNQQQQNRHQAQNKKNKHIPLSCLIPPLDVLRTEELLDSPSNDLNQPEGSFCRPIEEIPRDFLKLLSRMLSPNPEHRCSAQVALDSLDLILASKEYKKLCEDASDEFRVLFPNRNKTELKREIINRHELPVSSSLSAMKKALSSSSRSKSLSSSSSKNNINNNSSSIFNNSDQYRAVINSIPSSKIIQKLLSRPYDWEIENQLWGPVSSDKNNNNKINDALDDCRFYPDNNDDTNDDDDDFDNDESQDQNSQRLTSSDNQSSPGFLRQDGTGVFEKEFSGTNFSLGSASAFASRNASMLERRSFPSRNTSMLDRRGTKIGGSGGIIHDNDDEEESATGNDSNSNKNKHTDPNDDQ